MRRAIALVLLAGPMLIGAAACSKQTELASNANGKGRETVAAAATGTPPPEIPADELAAMATEQGAAPADPAADQNAITPKETADTAIDYRASVAGDINALPSVGKPQISVHGL